MQHRGSRRAWRVSVVTTVLALGAAVVPAAVAEEAPRPMDRERFEQLVNDPAFQDKAAGRTGPTEPSTGLGAAAIVAAPGNDDFANATSIAQDSTTSSTNVGATLETDEPTPLGTEGATVWYRVTPSTSGQFIIDTAGSDFDTTLSIYTGSALAGLSPLRSNDDTTSDVTSRLLVRLSAGTTYHIQVGGFGGSEGLFDLRVRPGTFDEYDFVGRVVRSDTGRPVAEACVYIYAFQQSDEYDEAFAIVLTDASGNYRLDDLGLLRSGAVTSRGTFAATFDCFADVVERFRFETRDGGLVAGPNRFDFVVDSTIPELVSYFPGTGGWWSTQFSSGTVRATELFRYGTRTGWQTHLASDADYDAVPELYSYAPSNGTWWRTNVRRGVPISTEKVATYGTRDGWTSHHIADLDLDGFMEFVSYHEASGRWWSTEFDVFSGEPTSTRLVTTYGTKAGWQEHHVVDVTQDGVPDLLSYHEPTGRWWLTDVSTGTARQRLLTTYGTKSGWQSHHVGDLDGDDKMELLSYAPSNGSWWRTTILSASRVSSTRKVTTYGTKDGWQQHVVVDTNQDGADELLSYSDGNGTWWRTPVTDGRVGSTRKLATYGTPKGWQSHLVIDIR